MAWWLELVEAARVEAERKKVEELAAAQAEAIEKYKGSKGFKTLVLDAMWRPSPIPFGLELLFTFPLSTNATSPSDAEARGGADASGGESTLDAKATV
ncbi:unnamed protein product [Prunus armeniaca]